MLCGRGAIKWSLPKVVQGDARLVLTEIAANACRICPGETLTVWLALTAARVLELAVWDPDPVNVPELKVPGDEDESGRGLFLVEEFAAKWGWYVSSSGGKVVWARLVW